MSHQLNFKEKLIQNFITELNKCCLFLKDLKTGSEIKIYENIWNKLSNKDLTTAYIVILLAKLHYIDEHALKRYKENKKNEEIKNSENEKSTENLNNENIIKKNENFTRIEANLLDLINYFNLGSYKYSENNVILLKRKQTIKKINKIVVEEDKEIFESVEIEEGENSEKNSEENEKFRDVIIFSEDENFERNSIINSMIYVTCFYRFDFADASLLYLLEKYIILRKEICSYFNSSIIKKKEESLLNELREALCPPTEAILKYSSICIDFEVVREKQNCLPAPLNRSDPLLMLPAYAFSRLQTVYRISKYTDEIIKDISNLFKSYFQKQEFDRISNILSFCEIILFQLFINFNKNKFDEFIKLLSPLVIEPFPIGEQSFNILEKLKREKGEHGCLLRERFENSVKIRKDKERNKFVFERKEIHVFYNSFSTNAKNFADKFDFNSEYSNDELINSAANLVLNIFEYYLDNSLSKEPVQILADHYVDISRVMKENSGNDSAIKEKLEVVKKQILEDIKVFKDVKKTVVRSECPKIPEIKFDVIKLTREDDITLNDREKKSYPHSFILDEIKELIKKESENELKYEKEKDLVLDIAIAGGSGTIQHFIQAYTYALSNNILNNVTIKLYIIPLGENNYLANWLDKYDGWYSRHLFYPILSPLYLIPQLKTENTKKVRRKASVLVNNLNISNSPSSGSSNSSTTNATTGSVLRKISILADPVKVNLRIDSAELNDYKSPKKFLTPHKFLKNVLNDYFIDSRNKLKINIFLASCFSKKMESNTNIPNSSSQIISSVSSTSNQNNNQNMNSPNVIESPKKKEGKVCTFFFFSQRMDVGFLPEILQFQRNEKLFDNTIEEIEKHQNFKYAGLNLGINYTPMDPCGSLWSNKEICEEKRTYNLISIKNCSNYGDKGNLKSPTQEWLEVIADEYSPKKKKKKELEFAYNYHVGNISIESVDKCFSILLDGELYGPFYKIQVTKAKETIDLMTFTNIFIY